MSDISETSPSPSGISGQKLSSNDLIRKSNVISDALDKVITHFNDLRKNFILQSNDPGTKKIEDLLERYWEPLSSQILQFQTQWNLVISDVSMNESSDVAETTTNPTLLEPGLNDADFDSDEILPPPAFESDSEESKSFKVQVLDSESYREDVLDILKEIEYETTSSSAVEAEQSKSEEVKIEKQESPTQPEFQRIIFKNFIKSEETYFSLLKSLNNAAKGLQTFDEGVSHPTIDTSKIFGGVGEILKFHEKWLTELQSKSESEEFACLLQFLINLRSILLIYKSHSQNYPSSLDALNKYRSNKVLAEKIPKAISTDDVLMILEDALLRPINRMSEYFNLTNDILQKLPDSHPSYGQLIDLNDELTIFFEVNKTTTKDKKYPRTVVKWAPVVEYFEGARKNRLIIVVTDYLICCGESNKSSYSHKWHCSFKDLNIADDLNDMMNKTADFTPIPKVHIDELKEECNKIKKEIESQDAKKHSRKIEKLEKHLREKMSHLVLKYASFPLKLYFPENKTTTLLFMTDKLCKSWHHLLKSRKNSELIERKAIYLGEINGIVESITKKYEVSFKQVMPNSIFNSDSPRSNEGSTPQALNGRLFMCIHIRRNESIQHDVVFSVELDKHIKGFKQSPKNSKHNISTSDTFSFELDNSQGYIYITSFKAKSKGGDQMGIFVVNLMSDEIYRKPFIRKKKNFKWGDALVFFEFLTNNGDPKYINKFNALNPSIEAIAELEQAPIPSIIAFSLDYIENHGLDEVGIYRISGVSSKIAQLHQQWQEGWITEYRDLQGMEVHTIASNLKQFLRQLETPLIPCETVEKLLAFNYRTDSYEKFSKILSELNPVSRSALELILNHLLLVENHKENNKMTFQNLSTVFGVNILRKKSGNSVNDDNLSTGSQITAFVMVLEFWKRFMTADSV